MPGPGPGPSGVTAITSGPGDKGFPAISGNIIIWHDNSTMSVQVYDVASGRIMTIPGNNAFGAMRQMDVSGNYVVWVGANIATMSPDIYLCDITSGSVTPVTNDQAYQMSPSISRNTICWNEIDMTTGKGKVYVYDLATRKGSTLTGNNTAGQAASNQIFPAIGGDTLAWLDDGGAASGYLNLNWLSLSGRGSAIIEPSSNPFSPPAVSSDGRRIVWVAVTDESPALRMLDVTTRKTQQITGEGAMPANPAVDGNYIVWADYRNGNGDIYLYDIQSGRERQITSDNAEQMFPDISGDRIVWMSNSGGAWNIYSASVGGGVQPTMGPTPELTKSPTPTPTKSPTPTPTKSPFIVKSSAFANGTSIPVRHTCDGDDVSPPLSWSGVPAGTQSLALIMDDPDAPGGTFTHWVIYNISPAESGLAEGLPGVQVLPGGMHQGKNSFGTTGYSGPCPPAGLAHHYIYHLYALNRSPNLPATADRAALEADMRGCIIAEGVLVGTYGH